MLRSFLTMVMLVALSGAQSSPDPADKVAAIKQALAQSQAALKAYTWAETTDISLNGEIKKHEQKQCRYGPDGKVQKTSTAGPNSSTHPAPGGRGGRLKEAIAEHKIEDLKDYTQRAAALVHEYVPPDPQKVQAAIAAKGMSLQPESEGVVTLTIKDYLKPGDALSLGFDPSMKQVRSYKVQSYVDKPVDDALTLDVTFASLPDGTNYPQQSILDVHARKLRVEITNSGYTKTAP